MALSHDAQISAVYFARDVAAVGLRDMSTLGAGGTIPYKSSIQRDAAYDAGGLVCGSATTPIAKVRFLSDDWDSATIPATRTTRIVAYYLDDEELHRLVCAGGTTSDTVLAHNVAPATFSVTGSSALESVPPPQTVTLAFSVTLPSVGGYPITLTGQRRQQ
jgi:hypothetical protein